MNYIYIGRYVNTHGIKGEIRILSYFEYKKLIFKKDFKIYIGNDKKEFIIKTYRKHKNYDMVTLDGINDIDQILPFKGSKVYIERSDLKTNEPLNEDYIGLEVYTNKLVGKIVEIVNNGHYNLFVIKNEDKKYMIPKLEPFIEKIDFENNKIILKEIEGLIDED